MPADETNVIAGDNESQQRLDPKERQTIVYEFLVDRLKLWVNLRAKGGRKLQENLIGWLGESLVKYSPVKRVETKGFAWKSETKDSARWNRICALRRKKAEGREWETRILRSPWHRQALEGAFPRALLSLFGRFPLYILFHFDSRRVVREKSQTRWRFANKHDNPVPAEKSVVRCSKIMEKPCVWIDLISVICRWRISVISFRKDGEINLCPLKIG